MKLRFGVFAAILTLALAAVPPPVHAQSTGKPYRIGFLGNTTDALEANLVGPFREGLREHGHTEGQDVLIEYRWLEGRYDRLPALLQHRALVMVSPTCGSTRLPRRRRPRSNKSMPGWSLRDCVESPCQDARRVTG